MNIKNDIFANDEYCKANELQKVLYNLYDALEILYFHKFHMVDVLPLPFLLRCLICNVLLFSVYFFLDIACRIFFVSQGFPLYALISILPLFFLIAAYYFYDIFSFHHGDILDFAGIDFFDTWPNTLYNKGLVGFEVLFCILDKFSYKNNSIDLLVMQGDI